jgi:hypothetical protein
MSRRVSTLGLFCCLTSLLVLQKGGQAQQPAPPPDSKASRTLYLVKNGDPTALADVLNKYFKGEAEVFAVPPGSGNSLLISGSTNATKEIVKLLEELDRKPRMVEVEVVLAEISPKKADGKDPTEFDLTGPEVLTKLEALGKAGLVGSIQRITLTASEGQPIASTIGGNKPVTSAVVRGAGGFGGGPAQRSITYQSVGTTVRMTARIGTGNAISLDLDIKDSQVKAADPADEAGAPVFDNTTLTTKLNVPVGRAVLAQGARAEVKSGRSATVVIVRARISDPIAESNKQ